MILNIRQVIVQINFKHFCIIQKYLNIWKKEKQSLRAKFQEISHRIIYHEFVNVISFSIY